MEKNDEDRTALIFLGTGCSGAVPEFRCLLQPSDPPCHVCSQSLSLLPHLNPNYRCNTSLLIDYCCEEEDGRHYYIIIDVGKSFREQVLRWFTFYKIPRIDSIILTHEHADAIHGLDDIRSFQPRGSATDTNPLPVFLSQFTMESISTRFPYLIEKKAKQVPRRVSQLDWRIIEENCDKQFIASGLSFTPLPVMHGDDYVALGFLFGHKSKVAYISDVSRIPPSTEYAISKEGAGQLDLLILDTNIPFKRGLQPFNKTRLLCSPNSLPIETPPHIISLGAGEAFGRRRRAICTTARSSPSSASFFVVLSLCSVVSVVSNNAVSSSFSVTTAPVLSSTYLRVSPPPPLLTVMKSSHLSTLPETISNHGRSLLLTLSVLLFHPGIVKPRTCGSMLSMKNLQLDPTYAEPLEPDLLVSLVLGFTSPSPVRRLCQSTPLSRLSPSPDRVTNASHRLHPTPASFLTCLYATDYTPNIEAAPSHQGFYGAKLHRLDLRLLVTTGPIVQECCFARFPHEVFTVASLSHYAVSSIDGSSQNRICGLPDLLVAGTIVQECGLARFTNSITAAIPSHYAVSSIDGSSQLCDLHTGVVTRRPIHPEAFYLLSDVCSHTLWLNESDDYLLRSSVTTCWARHGNVEFRVLDPIQPSALSSNLCSPSASLEVKLELEIHLVYSVSHVGFKADRTCFSAKSSQIGLSSLNVVYGSGASHLKFLPINIPTSSYRCFNVVFDYQLFFRTIAMGTKVKLLFGFLHFAERDSPLYGSISSFSVLVSSFILPSSRAPGLSASAVNVAL